MGGKRSIRNVAAVLICLLVLAAESLFGQSGSSGLVTGVVTDPSGAAIIGATVTLQQQGTGATQTAHTDADGRYVFPSVNPANYTLTFAAQGFATTVVQVLKVEVLKSSTVNITLQIGTNTQTITVSEASAAVELQTTTATVGEVLGGEALESLPVFTRSASALMFYQPAVSPSGQIAGARDEQITFTLDGGDVTSDLEGNNGYAAPPGEPTPSPVVPIPIESTQEFQVATTNPNSTFARSSGGQVAVLTKAGTNTFHGSAYEFHNDDGLNANTWTNNRLRIHKPHGVDNRFGATLGGPIWKNKFFFFGNYEGRRFYDDSTFNTVIPTATLRSGILQFRDASGAVDQFSFQPGNVTTACGGVSCDPRNIGMSSAIAAQMALYPTTGNNSALGDGLNTTGFTFNAPTPVLQDIGVLRGDYKINRNWNSFVTYHFADTTRTGTEQFNIVNTGAPRAVSGDPIKAWFGTFQVQGQLTSNLISVTHGSFLRDWWGWDRLNPVPLVSGLQETLSLAGEGVGTSNSTGKLIADPIVNNTQSARARVFDGHKWYLAQDFSWSRGTHLFQFGGSGYISHNFFEKTDNFAGGLTAGPIDYIEAQGNGSGQFVSIPSADRPALCGGAVTTNCLTSANVLRYNELYATLLGLVDRSSQVLTRNGSFQPNPLGTPMFSNTLIPAANGYFQDIWQLRHNLTLTLGLDWQVQPTPHESTGKYDLLVYASTNQPVDYQGYFEQRGTSLNGGVLPGQAFNPLFGVSPVGSVAAPFTNQVRVTDWHEFGPRISAAWQIDRKTVVRGGYSIVYERFDDINEVSLVLTTGGLLDVDACGGPVLSGGSPVCTNGRTDPSSAFRIGVDGNSVPVPAPFAAPIPYVPSGSSTQPFGLFMMSGLDPYTVPGHDHSIDFTVQRELPWKMILEVGYIGRISRNLFNEYSLNAADYLMKDKASGQTYAQAFDGVAQALRTATAIPDEPFFDNQIGLAKCTGLGFANCSAMVAKQDPTDLINGSLNFFSLNEFNLVAPVPVDNMQSFQSFAITDGGYSNYNAGFASLKKSFGNGLQFQGNWTWSHAIGNQGVDQQSGSTSNSPYNINLDRASESFDRRHIITAWFYDELPVGKGRRFNVPSPLLDRLIGGWYTSGIYTFATGTPLYVSANGDYGDYESKGTGAICSQPLGTLYGQHYGVVGSNNIATSGNASSGGSALNLFANPVTVYQSCSRPLLSTEGRIPYDQLRMPATWNLDFALGKDFAVTERYHLVFSAEMLNLFNLVNYAAPSLSLNSPTNFGVFTTQANLPRRVLLGLKFQF